MKQYLLLAMLCFQRPSGEPCYIYHGPHATLYFDVFNQTYDIHYDKGAWRQYRNCHGAYLQNGDTLRLLAQPGALPDSIFLLIDGLHGKWRKRTYRHHIWEDLSYKNQRLGVQPNLVTVDEGIHEGALVRMIGPD